MKPFLLIVVGDVEPFTRGPYHSPATRDKAARAYRKRHGREDGLYRLDIGKDWGGKPCPHVSAFRRCDLEGDGDA